MSPIVMACIIVAVLIVAIIVVAFVSANKNKNSYHPPVPHKRIEIPEQPKEKLPSESFETLRFCLICGSEVPDDEKFCPKCGKQV